jgi:hypothetical protein
VIAGRYGPGVENEIGLGEISVIGGPVSLECALFGR